MILRVVLQYLVDTGCSERPFHHDRL